MCDTREREGGKWLEKAALLLDSRSCAMRARRDPIFCWNFGFDRVLSGLRAGEEALVAAGLFFAFSSFFFAPDGKEWALGTGSDGSGEEVLALAVHDTEGGFDAVGADIMRSFRKR